MPGDRKRVLIADDDGSIRELLHSILRARDLSVDSASDGGEAIALLRENQYAVVLLDLLMPGVDGFEVLDRLRSPDIRPQPVVLVITGADRSVFERLDPQSIHGVMRKPFEPDELADLVVACVEVRGQHGLGAMALATMLAGSPLWALFNKWSS